MKNRGRGVSQHLELRSLHHMRHVPALSPAASIDCAYFPSPRGCTSFPSTERKGNVGMGQRIGRMLRPGAPSLWFVQGGSLFVLFYNHYSVSHKILSP